MLAITLYPITGVMLGVEIQHDDFSNVFVIDLLILRIMFEWINEND